MLTFRRSLIVAAALLTFFLLLRNSHRSPSQEALHLKDSPKPNGEFHDYKQLSDFIPTTPPQSSLDTGKKQSHWNGDNGGRVALASKPKQQVPLEEMKLKPLRQQLAYAFPYTMDSKFPSYVWQTWKYAPSSGEFEERLRSAEASWTELHPNFVHEVITDSVAVGLIRLLYASIPEVLEAYNALPLPVLKADFFRYLILLARGGIYSDIDTIALKSVVEWVPSEVPRSSYGLVIGIEADPDRPDWQDWYSRRIQFCQWTIQSKPGHPVLVDIVATITEETLRRKRAGKLNITDHEVVEFTGPAIWTDAIFKFFNNPEFFDMSTSKGNITWQQFTGITEAKKVGDVIVLPITSFSPGVQQMGAGEIDDPMAFVQHEFVGSWKPEVERMVGGESE